ncbi:MAG: tRNA (guanosine(37)-N1)-methyltransferase TrmD [candidate division KSB1 bacterium]|nr:tRNA (guanosine(37)-N1)-methyltransferase TrmD [candidate division KSB1 bacterium]
MEVHILTIFPEMLQSPLQASILQRAQERCVLRVQVHNLRDFTTDRHRVTDDYPYGGGAGMIMKPEPIVAGIQDIQARYGPAYVILLSPQGTVLTHDIVTTLAQRERLLLICGRYGGVDARVQAYVQAEISIGDYVLTGGELPAMVLLDAVARQLPGVLGDYHSVEDDSLFHGLLQGPQYTRPVEFAGARVPDVLLSGNHAAIRQWRRRQALRTTLRRRPDLLQRAVLTPQDRAILLELQHEEAEPHAQ